MCLGFHCYNLFIKMIRKCQRNNRKEGGIIVKKKVVSIIMAGALAVSALGLGGCKK